MKRITSFIITLIMLFGGFIGLVLPSGKASAAEDKEYLVPGGSYVRTINENIYYSSVDVSSYVNPYNMPGYALGYSCGITAGVNLIAWYNRIKPALIPNHTAGSTILGTWIWAAQTATINNLFPTVYTLMGATSSGVTINGYLTGLKSYANSKNLSFSSTSLFNNGVLNQNYKTELSNGKLLTIFLDGFNFTYGPSTESGYHNLILEEYAGAHIMTVYGWREVSYKNIHNVVFRKDTYLHVGTGLSTSNGLLMISSYCTVDALYTTHIS